MGLRTGERVIESYDIASFVELVKADLASGGLTSNAKFAWEIMLEESESKPQFTTVLVIENEKGERKVGWVEPQVTE